jgi:hypothetical protein
MEKLDNIGLNGKLFTGGLVQHTPKQISPHCALSGLYTRIKCLALLTANRTALGCFA